MITIIAGSYGVGKTSFAGVIKNHIEGALLETTLQDNSTEMAVKAVKEKGCKVRLFYIALDSADGCLARVRNRAAHGGLDTPEGEVQQSFDKRWERLMQLLPHCDEAQFYDNGNGFVKVAEYRDGQFRGFDELRPRWLAELEELLSKKIIEN